MINIFASTCPNRSGVGAIDKPDRFKQVFDPYYILEVPEETFTQDMSKVRRPEDVLNLLESPKKNLEDAWKNECHTSSAQLR